MAFFYDFKVFSVALVGDTVDRTVHVFFVKTRLVYSVPVAPTFTVVITFIGIRFDLLGNRRLCSRVIIKHLLVLGLLF
jgi:hypothetical protein